MRKRNPGLRSIVPGGTDTSWATAVRLLQGCSGPAEGTTFVDHTLYRWLPRKRSFDTKVVEKPPALNAILEINRSVILSALERETANIEYALERLIEAFKTGRIEISSV